MLSLDRARGNFGQEGCEREKILVVHQHDFHVVSPTKQTLQFQCGCRAGKAAAKNHNSRRCRHVAPLGDPVTVSCRHTGSSLQRALQ